ncbi:hypothetical protein [Nocardia sp. MW-W600-9]
MLKRLLVGTGIALTVTTGFAATALADNLSRGYSKDEKAQCHADYRAHPGGTQDCVLMSNGKYYFKYR